MKKVKISLSQMPKFAGKWVAIQDDKIIAVGETLKDISPFVTKTDNDKILPEKIPAAFKVPYNDEGPYIL
ncbi:hypothetical protein HY030_01325 [Candidatus Gottesmanbacteria bacterium]|nr:hypothetical protein [Candidatus Gottesmanbacteria bacterium]